MKRLHLFELEDQKWFPKNIRDCMTDLLNFQITCFQIYDPIVPILHQALIKMNTQQILDLCSGGAGSCRRVQEILEKDHGYKTIIKLSDLYPNNNASLRVQALNDESISYLSTSVDATKVPTNITGFRTLFTSFHHFDPHKAHSILQDAVNNDCGIAIFELSERSIRGLILALLSFFIALIFTPFLRPFCWYRLLFTYAIPIIPLSYLFDGVVSQLRSYTQNELLQMAQQVDRSYFWEAGWARHHYLPLKIYYLIGYRRSSNN